MKRSGGFLTFIVGLLAGGILGILFAPDKGIHTRDKLTFQLDKLKKQLERFIEDIVNEKDILSNNAKSEGDKVVKDAKDKAEQLLDDVNGLISQIKKN